METCCIYKNKGDKTDIKNYRGISVISPVAKLFEKLLAHQMTNYFESNNIFYSGHLEKVFHVKQHYMKFSATLTPI